MMIAAAEGKTRGCCPECRTPVRLGEDELGGLLSCNVCGTEFFVERKQRSKRIPRNCPATLPNDLDDIDYRRSVARRALYWMLGLLVIVLGTLFAMFNYAWLTAMVWE
jgi:hypothetical protein